MHSFMYKGLGYLGTRASRLVPVAVFVHRRSISSKALFYR